MRNSSLGWFPEILSRQSGGLPFFISFPFLIFNVGSVISFSKRFLQLFSCNLLSFINNVTPADRCGLLSSTLEYGSPVIGCYDWELAGMDKDNSEDLYKYNLRMIGCNQEGEPVSRINEGK